MSILTLLRRWREERDKALHEPWGLDGAGVPPLETEHFARDPQYPIEKLDQKFRNHPAGDPTL
jgi:hypothetical protein